MGLLGLVLLITMAASLPGEVGIKLDETTTVAIDSLFRSYLQNDQRLQWSGMETSFGVEAVLTSALQKRFKWGGLQVFSQFFFNQPFDANKLVDPARSLWVQNFQKETAEIKQLYIRIDCGNFAFGLGKHATLFGQSHMVSFSNSFFDFPFIRSEVVLNFETGLFFGYHPGIFTLDLAVVNGSEEMDTNSSKAGILRLGLHGKSNKWSLGASAKWQDGIGSEGQKQFKNHIGLDLMLRAGYFQFSAEAIYDQHGFYHDYPADQIFWRRSYYYRDVFLATHTPIKGVGGYIELQYEKPGSPWFLTLNYGEYYPEKIGNPLHDDPIRRAIVKLRWEPIPHLHAFAIGLFENRRTKEPLFSGASDYGFGLGMQYEL